MFLVVFFSWAASLTSAQDIIISCNSSDDLWPTGGATCITDEECSMIKGKYVYGVGFCKAYKCLCSQGFANSSCSYQRKSKNVAGYLQTFLVLVGVAGCGNFIIGRTTIAIVQLTVNFTFWTLSFLTYKYSFFKSKCGQIAFKTVVIIISIAAFVWSSVDGTLILQCVYKDANGMALGP